MQNCSKSGKPCPGRSRRQREEFPGRRRAIRRRAMAQQACDVAQCPMQQNMGIFQRLSVERNTGVAIPSQARRREGVETRRAAPKAGPAAVAVQSAGTIRDPAQAAGLHRRRTSADREMDRNPFFSG